MISSDTNSKLTLNPYISPQLKSARISELLARNELNLLLDEQMSEREREELQECEAVCRRFLEWDLNELIERKDFGSVRAQLEAIVEGSA